MYFVAAPEMESAESEYAPRQGVFVLPKEPHLAFIRAVADSLDSWNDKPFGFKCFLDLHRGRPLVFVPDVVMTLRRVPTSQPRLRSWLPM